ncbi:MULTISPECIES: NAD(P)/FAD-dependent oxidoreductase [unclassified Archaeoglobus]|jgi:NAD(P)H-nitrite reductase large subunit|uniref:NAD(P)/FAD-dependent oxidoreductase n=1 Tax=unclassified Archaeoglobus TaxID=2643606 RepID=UPI0025C3B13F|nr:MULTISPECIES: FAD-dependent oxidoreductase [unclassified Archaeoglobus]
MRYDFVVIGNSAGGIGCVEAIREKDRESSVLVISAEKYHAYSRALIPYYLDGKIDFERMYYRPPDFYEKMNVDTKLGVKAVGIDVEAKKVLLESGESVEYDKLLIATGGKPFIPPMEGLAEQSNVFTFLKMDDVLAVEKAIKDAKRVVVLGGGIIGLMASEVLAKKGLEVKVVELADRVLAPVVDEITSRRVEKKFEEHGVEIILNNTIAKVVGDERVEKVVLRDGRELETDMLIVAVGVVPNVEIVKDTPIKVNRGIVVNRKMETSVKDVYACGDCAEIYDFIFGANRVLPLWPTAYTGGRIAGFNMLGEEREYTLATSMNAMHFFDYYIINAGLNVPNDSEEFEVIYKQEGDSYRKFALKDGRIAGFIIAGKMERAGIFLRLMEEEIDVSPFKDKLLKDDFGYIDIPEPIRWELLEEKVKLGVVREI